MVSSQETEITVTDGTALEALRRNATEKQVKVQGGRLTDANLQNCIITSSIIRKSTLIGCTLVDCAVFDCKVYDTEMRKSQLKRCTIRNRPAGVWIIEPSFICRLEDCHARVCKISQAVIKGGGLENCYEVLHSKVDGAFVTRSNLTNCEVATAELHLSEMHQCTLNENTLRNSTITNSPIPLRQIPVEVRLMIFRDALESWEGKTPSLITALRGDQKMYQEAIEVLPSSCVLKISKDSLEGVSKMSLSARENVQRLSLIIPW